MAFINDYTEQYNPVARDDEHGIVLRALPTGPDPIYPFVLEWHGEGIKFAGENKKERFQNEDGSWRFNYEWTIISVTTPENFPESKETICAAISEAMDCFGEWFSRDRVGTVGVEFTATAFEAEGFY